MSEAAEDKTVALLEGMTGGASGAGFFEGAVQSTRTPRDPKDTTIPRPVRLLEDRILVRRDEASDKSGSIYIPGAHQVAPMEGTVVAVGPGRIIEPPELSLAGCVSDFARFPLYVTIGDRVLITRYAGNEFKFSPMDAETYVVMRADEVLMILLDPPEEPLESAPDGA